MMTIDVTIRNPFRLLRLPWLLRVYRLGYNPYTSQIQRNLIRKPFRKLYRLLRPAMKHSSIPMLVATPRGVRSTDISVDNLQYHSIFLAQHLPVYEPEIAAILTLLAPECACFWDVGANWGHHSLYLLSLKSFQGRVEAFEPNEEIAAEMRRHLHILGYSGNGTCHPWGLSSRSEPGLLEMPDGIHSGFARIIEGDSTSIRLNHRSMIQTRTGDSCKLAFPDIIKLDAEGSEFAILEGCLKVITYARPAIIVEIWPKNTELTARILEFLESHDYLLLFPTFTPLQPTKGVLVQDVMFQQVAGALELRPLCYGLAKEKINALAVGRDHPWSAAVRHEPSAA